MNKTIDSLDETIKWALREYRVRADIAHSEVEDKFYTHMQYKAALRKLENNLAQAITDCLNVEVAKARISELEQIKPPEQYKDYAKIAGREHCVICGFNSELFRRHIDDRIKALQGRQSE